MSNFLSQLNPIQRATLVWLALLAAAVVAVLMSIFFESGLVLLLLSVAILLFKGQMLLDHFMELRHVAKHWHRLMSAYCIIIGLFLVLAHFMN
ncbi:MAG: cytochrome c oxidase subunit IV [Oleiphilaceae bacterium]|jgi:cytochrome c oxidase subunit IV